MGRFEKFLLINSKSFDAPHILTNPIQVKLEEESESEEKIWKKISLRAQFGLLCILTILDNHA